MTTAVKAYEDVRESARGKGSDSPRLKVYPEAASPGDWVRQGDIYIYYLGESRPDFLGELVPTNERQLAPGSSRGSRHILSGGCEVFTRKDANALQGPVFRAGSDCTVTHPTHDHWKMFTGWFMVTYQRAKAEELRRVED